jgi:hypothetical protein
MYDKAFFAAESRQCEVDLFWGGQWTYNGRGYRRCKHRQPVIRLSLPLTIVYPQLFKGAVSVNYHLQSFARELDQINEGSRWGRG